MLQPLVRRTWARRGRTPLLKAWDRHDRLTVITALVWEPHRRKDLSMYFQVQRHNARTDAFVWFLVQLRRELKNHLIVIWDRLSAHHKAAQTLLKLGCRWISFEYLPAYCPTLNPVEHVWSTTKYGRLPNWPAPGIEALDERVTDELDKQSDDRTLLHGHFRWAGLTLD